MQPSGLLTLKALVFFHDPFKIVYITTRKTFPVEFVLKPYIPLLYNGSHAGKGSSGGTLETRL